MIRSLCHIRVRVTYSIRSDMAQVGKGWLRDDITITIIINIYVIHAGDIFVFRGLFPVFNFFSNDMAP